MSGFHLCLALFGGAFGLVLGAGSALLLLWVAFIALRGWILGAPEPPAAETEITEET